MLDHVEAGNRVEFFGQILKPAGTKVEPPRSPLLYGSLTKIDPGSGPTRTAERFDNAPRSTSDV
jgi:hypothetical protein